MNPIQTFLDKGNSISLNFDHVLSRYLLERTGSGPFTFIQVGAFDGVTCDPLRKYLVKYPWTGVMLEPQPQAFGKLAALYKGRDDISIMNAAINESNGEADLYVVENDALPEWARGMASFDEQNILKHADALPGLAGSIQKSRIKTVSFEQLLADHQFTRVNLLQIDTEGFDAEVLKLFPFSKIKPVIIHFESKHIPVARLENALARLADLGYAIARDGQEDMMAVLREQ